MLNQLTDHVYWTRPEENTDRPVLGYVKGGKNNLMVDTGNSPAHVKWFLALLREAGLKHPDYAVLTHWHWDHVFGAGHLNGTLIAQRGTFDKLQEMVNLDWRDKALDQRVEEGIEITFCRDCIKNEMSNMERSRLQLKLPDLSFEECMQVDLGDVTCTLQHIGGEHAVDSSVVFVEPDGVLFMGDAIYSAIYKNPPSYTVEALFPLLDNLLGFDAHWYLSSHAVEVMSRKDFEKLGHDLRLIGNNVEKHHGKRSEVMSALKRYKTFQLTDETTEWVEAFLAGYAGKEG